METIAIIGLVLNLFSFQVEEIDREGYYFTMSTIWELNDSGIWIEDYYDGFIDKDIFEEQKKIILEISPNSISASLIIVQERNHQTFDEENLNEFILGGGTFEIMNLLEVKKKSRHVVRLKDKEQVYIEIVYGKFRFKETEMTVKDYEESYFSTSHSRRSLSLKEEEKIKVYELIGFNDLRLLSKEELDKIKFKK